jgi:hypothetical protein
MAFGNSSRRNSPKLIQRSNADSANLVKLSRAMLLFAPRLRALSTQGKSIYLNSLFPILRRSANIDQPAILHLYRLFAVMQVAASDRQKFLKRLFSGELVSSGTLELKHFDDELVRLSLLKDVLALTHEDTIDPNKIAYCIWMAKQLEILSPDSESMLTKIRRFFSKEDLEKFTNDLSQLAQEFEGRLSLALRVASSATRGAHHLASLSSDIAQSYSLQDLANLRNTLEAHIADAIDTNDTTHPDMLHRPSEGIRGIRRDFDEALRADLTIFKKRQLFEFSKGRHVRKQIIEELNSLIINLPEADS